jgi:hypothetical protein
VHGDGKRTVAGASSLMADEKKTYRTAGRWAEMIESSRRPRPEWKTPSTFSSYPTVSGLPRQVSVWVWNPNYALSRLPSTSQVWTLTFVVCWIRWLGERSSRSLSLPPCMSSEGGNRQNYPDTMHPRSRHSLAWPSPRWGLSKSAWPSMQRAWTQPLQEAEWPATTTKPWV